FLATVYAGKGYGGVSDRPRILVLAHPTQPAANVEASCPPDSELVRADDVAHGLALLRTEHFDGIYADMREPAVCEWAGNLLQAEHILEALPDGVAVVNTDLCVLWANPALQSWCDGPVA